jgi:hypothetical protein
MKGVVFTEFADMVEGRFGMVMADAVMAKSASDGVYTSVGDYDYAELIAMVAELSRLSQVPIEELVEAFGHYLFGRFVAGYPEMFVGVDGALDLLEQVEDKIHVEVLKFYPTAALPRFDIQRDGSVLHMRYSSPRCLGDLARGLIRGCLEHYETPGTVTAEPEQEDGSVVRFTVRVDG